MFSRQKNYFGILRYRQLVRKTKSCCDLMRNLRTKISVFIISLASNLCYLYNNFTTKPIQSNLSCFIP